MRCDLNSPLLSLVCLLVDEPTGRDFWYELETFSETGTYVQGVHMFIISF